MTNAKSHRHPIPKITHKGIKFSCTALYFLWVLLAWHFSWPCVYQKFLGIPCPGCGMSHAALYALHLDFKAAFLSHPMFWSVPILYLYILYDGKLFQKKWLDTTTLVLIGLGFLVSYIIKLVLWFR